MRNLLTILPTVLLFALSSLCNAQIVHPDARYAEGEMLNIKANGFKGIWYMNQPSNDEYVYKYSGGMATYCTNHRPFAIYSKKVNKTFFCFGGTDEKNSTLFHNVSFFDHSTGEVSNPTIVLDKHTTDAHDNPVISMDDKGYIYIFSTAHGIGRPSYISKSVKPNDISQFKLLEPTEIVDGKEVPFNNFSYFQVWHVKGKGFIALFTKYNKQGNHIIGYNTSKDAVKWNEWKVLTHIEKGHYAISAERNAKVGLAFSYNPDPKGLNYRTNLYYLETKDFGKTWTTADGQKVKLPITKVDNPALVKDFKSEGLNCYVMDIDIDKKGNPVVMAISSKGYESGPRNNPRTWEIFSYNGKWNNSKVTTSDNNYDTGSIYLEKDDTWRIIAPTEQGPQHYNPGGEMAMWVSTNNGIDWQNEKQMTNRSLQNHNYARKPVNAHADFYSIWADGHGRKPSASQLYFSNKEGDVYLLPEKMDNDKLTPVKMQPNENVDTIAFITKKFETTLQAGNNPTKIPKTTNKDGSLRTTGIYDWTSGFFAGNLWYIYALTNDGKWKNEAIKWTEALDTIQYWTGNHDVGFMMYCSYGNGLKFAGLNKYKGVLLQTAESLSKRYSEKTKTIKSWDYNKSWDGKTEWFYPVIIDNMMNLELLFEASILSGNPKYRNIAVQHAETTMKNHYRNDYSCYHVVDYDSISGNVLDRATCQGFADESSWARGQAWGLYGYVLCYRYTQDKKFLSFAENIAAYMLKHKNLPEDMIPYWDYNAVDKGFVPEWKYNASDYPVVPRDASAAAVTASALYELSTYSEKKQEYLDAANKMVASLLTPAYLAVHDNNRYFLLDHSVGSIPHGVEIDVPLVYADYYFLEALYRKQKLEQGKMRF
ncbi:MAG: BNR-4 repeat-containing protein [Prolixibacteraceae bacterium]|nr:BNR-4 repeat-containing protein [Prolixibacteraceae bacterium]